jgi:membrane protein DedA with SNARE-associated domain
MVSPQYLLEHYGYRAVFIAILLEDFGFPMPGETLLITGSIVVARSRLGLPPPMFIAAGAAAWASFWSVLFYVFGQRAHRIVVWFKRIELPVVVMGIAFMLMAIAFLIVRRNRAGKKPGNRKDGEA